jgi:ribosome-binding protein aMBF1 (putative translation factor)
MRPKNLPLEEMTLEQRAAIESIRSRRPTPEANTERGRFLEEIESEVLPASPDDSLLETLEVLKTERERQGLSLAAVSERTGMDQATLSRLETGKVANPTDLTIRTYARALGKRVAWRVEEDAPASVPLTNGQRP